MNNTPDQSPSSTSTSLALQFPGQGAQFVGMGQDFYEEKQPARDVFDRADGLLGYSLSELCFDGPSERLTETRHSQPAILVTSIAIYRTLQDERDQLPAPIAVAGLSLGEYTALVAAGALTFEDAVNVVQIRAEAMQEDCDREPSGMASILGLDQEEVEEICEEASSEGVIGIANVNSPGQIVISGAQNALDHAIELAEARDARRVIPLKVAGAFHSDLMKPAQEQLTAVLEDVDIQSPDVPVITNTTGEVVSDPEEIRTSLSRQITSPVLWKQTVDTFLEQGVGTFLELGPGRVLSGLAKKVHRRADTRNVQSLEDLDELEL